MHQVLFRLGLRPRPRWVSLQNPGWILRGLLLRGASFFSVSPAFIMFCYSCKPTGIIIRTPHSWVEKFTKFGQLILSKIIKSVAISCHFWDCKALLFESRKQRYSKYPDLLAGSQGFPSKRREGKERKGRERGNKSPEWLSQKLGTTANAAVNSETALNLIRWFSEK